MVSSFIDVPVYSKLNKKESMWNVGNVSGGIQNTLIFFINIYIQYAL
jgi:hypothetical protein